MFAIATTSPLSKNNVRSHIVKYNKKEHFYSKGEMTLAQVDTPEYRELHRLMATDPGELIKRFTSKKPSHKIDVSSLTVHSMDCKHISDDHILASISNISSTGLNLCEHCISE